MGAGCAPKASPSTSPALPPPALSPDASAAFEASDVAELERQLAQTREQLRVVTAQADDLRQRLERIEDRQADRAAVARRGRPDPADRYKVAVDTGQVRGQPTALVTIVEWADFQCPFSARVRATLAELERKYGSDLRIVFKHNPLAFHQQALAAAIASEAAGEQGKFWAMHDKLFDNLRAINDDNILKWARKLGLDLKQFKRSLRDPQLQARVKAMQAQAVTLGASGTPAFFINGRFLSGAQPVEAFSKLIDEEMAAAQSMVRAGVDRTEVYARTIRDGRERPE